MRHGRKSRSTLVDGYQRHVLTDLDSGLVGAVGSTPANAPEATVTDAIATELAAQDTTLVELHIDRAELASTMVRGRGQKLAISCKAWRVGNAGRCTKTDFRIDFDNRQPTCPNQVVLRFEPGRSVHFPKAARAVCPLRVRCTTSSTGRSVAVHPDEALLVELRQRRQTPHGRARLRERTKVEHSLAHIGHWQGRRARYLGPARTCSTSAAPPWSTTSTSSPASHPAVSRSQDYLADALEPRPRTLASLRAGVARAAATSEAGLGASWNGRAKRQRWAGLWDVPRRTVSEYGHAQRGGGANRPCTLGLVRVSGPAAGSAGTGRPGPGWP
jgi:hypothetical protein